MQWEYIVFDSDVSTTNADSVRTIKNQTTDVLNGYGQHGWELVGVVRIEKAVRHYLKRPTPTQ